MIRSLTFTCLVLVFLSQSALSMTLSSTERPYYPRDFYSNIASGQRDTDLKNEIHKILSSVHVVNPGQNDSLDKTCPSNKTCYRHISLGYGPARRLLFGKLHLEQTHQGYAIRDVYCQQMLTNEDFRGNPPGPGEIPDPNVMNTEHTWPQSRFSGRFDKDLQKSDLHILFPVSTKSNSSRGNIEFGDVVTVTSSPCPKAERGYTARGGRKSFFEVPDAHKGNTARAIFYFSSRYQLSISAEEEDSLKAWHRADPVDSDELTRNSAIFDQQKDRNPFIDHPELVELISDF
jgi:deoxyribonuclease-1